MSNYAHNVMCVLLEIGLEPCRHTRRNIYKQRAKPSSHSVPSSSSSTRDKAIVSSLATNGNATCTVTDTLREGCSHGTICTVNAYCVVATGENDCANRCVDNESCIYYEFDPSNGTCVIYPDCCLGDQQSRRRSVARKYLLFDRLAK